MSAETPMPRLLPKGLSHAVSSWPVAHDIPLVSPATLQQWLHDGAEIALFDVREAGQFGESHLLFAIPLPYSRLEIDVLRLAPNPSVRMVLVDDDGRLSERAAGRLKALGYTGVHILDGGQGAWVAAGHKVVAGVNVPSKAFGELVEHECHTPSITAQALHAMQQAGQNVLILDGRPLQEHRKMAIPGAICCPNGELPYRIADMLPGPDTPVVIHCAGRTRSIIGAQTLLNLGLPNPVYALENGTQGWYLNDFQLEHGSTRAYPSQVGLPPKALHTRARELARQAGVVGIDCHRLLECVRDPKVSVFLCDVRTPEEFADFHLPGAQHTPGGQLVQATDQYIGVRNAVLVLYDTEGLRAWVSAHWLRQLGHQACVLTDDLPLTADALRSLVQPEPSLEAPPLMAPAALNELLPSAAVRVIDLRASAAYRQGHVPGSQWAIRPMLARQHWQGGDTCVFVADEPAVAALAARELPEGVGALLLEGSVAAWQAAGYPLQSTPDEPADSERIDYLFFVHDRHDGNKAAARQYLAWELGLVADLDPQDRAVFSILDTTH